MTENLPAEAKQSLERNGIVFDVASLSEEFAFIREMNEIEVASAFALFHTGCPAKSAALLHIGHYQIVSASRKTSVQRLIRILVKSDLQSSGIKKAYDALTNVMDDTGESANARIKAAETILKWSGEIGKETDKDREDELSSMTIGELESMIGKLQAKREELSKDVIEHAQPVQ